MLYSTILLVKRQSGFALCLDCILPIPSHGKLDSEGEMQSAVWNEKYHVLFVLESSAGRSNYLRLNNKARVVQCNLEGVP